MDPKWAERKYADPGRYIKGLLRSGVNLNSTKGSANNDTPLNIAAGKGNTSVAIALIEARQEQKDGKDGVVVVDLNVANKKGRTPLISAAHNGHLAIVQALLKAPGKDGVACDVHRAQTNSKQNENGVTALNWVVQGSAQRYDDEAKDPSRAPPLAKNQDCAEIVKALLDAKADVNQADVDNGTPLMYATPSTLSTCLN